MKEHVEKTILDNGVRIITERITQFRSATIGIWVDVGSLYEEDHNRGMSHFLEHSLFKGTPTRNAHQIAETMDGIGGNLNAFTEKEQTCFIAKVMDKHIPLAMEMMGDMLLNAHFPDEEVEKEKNVVLEEIKMYEDSPDELIFDLLAEACWKNHPLSLPILGSAESIRGIKRDTILDFVKDYYTPEQITVAVAGHVKHEDIVEKVKRYFPFAAGAKSKKKPLGSPQFTSTTVIKEKAIEQVHVCLGMNGVSQKDDRRHALLILDTILGGSVSSRLFQEIREKRGLAYSVTSLQASYGDGAIFGVYAATAPSNLKTVMNLLKEILSDVRAKGITKAELKKAKEHLKGVLSLSFESTSNRMIRLAKGELYHGRFTPHDEVLKKIQAVTLDDVKNVAKDVLQIEHGTWAVVGQVPDDVTLG